MKKEIMEIGMLREEMQRFVENVIFEKEMFLRDKSYRQSITTESIAFVVMSNKFYKKGFDLYSKTKNMRCFEGSTFDIKLKDAYTAQFYVEVADKLMTAYSKEERPEYFTVNNGQGRLGIKGLLKLMNSGKFYKVDALIDSYTSNMDVDREYLNELCAHIDSMDIEDVLDFVTKVLEVGLYIAFPTARNRELSAQLKSAHVAVEAEKEAVVSSESLEEVVDYLILDEEEEVVDYLIMDDEDECWELQPVSLDEVIEEEVVISGGLLEKEDEVIDYLIIDEEWESQNLSQEDREKREIIREAYEFINSDWEINILEEKTEFIEEKTLHEMIEDIRAEKISGGLLIKEDFDDSVFDVIMPVTEEEKSESFKSSLPGYTALPELEDVEVEIHIPYNTKSHLGDEEFELDGYDFDARSRNELVSSSKKHSFSNKLAKFFNIF